jgi:anti-sigma factor RsiW
MSERPSSECRAYLERLSRYVDGELPPRTRKDTVLHLRHCPCCHELVDSLRQTVTICHAAGRRRLPPDVRARAKARIEDLLAHPPSGPRRSR